MKFLTLCVVSIAVLVGCASEEEPNFAYAADFEQAKRDAKSDFERDVLADNKVTDAEYDEGFNRFASCLSEYEYTFIPDPEVKGAYRIEDSKPLPDDPELAEKVTAQMDKDIEKCQENSLGSIEWLYLAVRDNPLNEDLVQLTAECLVRAGVREQGYTVEHYLKDMDSQEFAELPEVQACSENPKE